MTINVKDQIVNRLIACIYFDKADVSIVKIAIDQALMVLKEFNMIVPGKQFEILVNTTVSEQMIGKFPSGHDAAKFLIAKAMLEIAEQLFLNNNMIPNRDKKFLSRRNVDKPIFNA